MLAAVLMSQSASAVPVKLESTPTAKGIYIHNGKKVVNKYSKHHKRFGDFANYAYLCMQ